MRILIWILVILLALPAAGIGLLLATGTIDTSSVKMMLNVMTGMGGPQLTEDQARQRLGVPEGFGIGVFAQDLPRARFLRFTANGDLLVSRPHAGDIVLLQRDSDGDGRSDGRSTLLSDLRRPLGLDLHGGWLYIAESNRIARIAFDDATGTVSGDYEVIVDGLTDDGNHWSKTLRVGPDEQLYLAQGSTCNICDEPDERRATLMRFAPDGSNPQILATGLRNSVGFDWAPWDGGLYATDNGRDLLGDDFPPCELNLIEAGQFYGWPYFNGDNLPDPDMGADPLAGERQPTAPVHGFRAHNAPLGITFPDTGNWPSPYARTALVALHGSWNRSSPDGYKVVSLHWSDQGIEERDFLSGFNKDGDISGRPVDVAQGPDGAIYVSDDYAGAIYRVAYGERDGAALAVATKDTSAEPDWVAAIGPDQRAAGAQLYAVHGCAECHEKGENPHRLKGLADRRSYSQIMESLVAPQSPMPVYPLEEDERRALVAYLMGL